MLEQLMATLDLEEVFREAQEQAERHKAERKRKQEVFAADYKTEVGAATLIRRFLNREQWTFEEQVNTPDGNRIDFLVDTFDTRLGRQVTFGIECKRQISEHYESGCNATVLADYLEQSAAYSRSLGVPVFIGPVQTKRSPSSAYLGGPHVDSLRALNIFGGRFNVGTMNFSNNPHTPEFFILRGATFWDTINGFNPKRLNMVTSTGSKKQRTDL
jgi:hypothetical protein